MTKNQKLAISVAVAITLPLWFLPAVIGLFCYVLVGMVHNILWSAPGSMD